MKISFDYEIFWKQKFGGIASRYFFNLIDYFFNKDIYDIKVFSKLYFNRRLEELPKENVEQDSVTENRIDDFEFNQDISYEKEIRSPGWLRLQKKLNEKK